MMVSRLSISVDEVQRSSKRMIRFQKKTPMLPIARVLLLRSTLAAVWPTLHVASLLRFSPPPVLLVIEWIVAFVAS